MATSMQAAREATIVTHDTGKPARMLVCPDCGGEFSATAGDYFMARPGHTFTHMHEGITVPLSLVERRSIYGTDADGRSFAGSVAVIITEDATIEDLEK